MEPGKAINEDQMEPNSANSLGQQFLKGVYEWVKVITIALLIALPIRFFIAEPFIVNGPSMDPTFSTGQFLIVDRVTYRFDEPKRGDVIVFRYPNNPKTYYIKRIIGLPGETVDIDKGKVTITQVDGEKISLEEPYISPSHISRDTYSKKLTNTQYYVMGDNRAQSSDSRYWGPLDKKLIIGRPIIRLYPPNVLSIFPGNYKI